MDETKRRTALGKANEVFRPSAPVDHEDLFTGRHQQMTAVMNAIHSVGQHAVIFGERGVGKTSLSAVCGEMSRHGACVPIRINADPGDNFASIWQKVIDEFPIVLDDYEKDERDQLDAVFEEATEILNASDLSPSVVRVGLRRITSFRNIAVFVDEFDQISDPVTLTLFSNTIKLLSDRIEPATLIAVGVGDSVEQLILGHQSIQRALVQVRMPRMTDEEIGKIVTKGLDKLEMSTDEEVLQFIKLVARGLPQYAHLLAQEGVRVALISGRSTIEMSDVLDGLENGLARVDHSLSEAYEKATYTARPSHYKELLAACSIARVDDNGFFSPADLKRPFGQLIDKQDVRVEDYNRRLEKLSESRGQILTRTGGARQRRYRFTDSLMEPYVLLKGLNCGLIDTKVLFGVGAKSKTDKKA